MSALLKSHSGQITAEEHPESTGSLLYFFLLVH